MKASAPVIASSTNPSLRTQKIASSAGLEVECPIIPTEIPLRLRQVAGVYKAAWAPDATPCHHIEVYQTQAGWRLRNKWVNAPEAWGNSWQEWMELLGDGSDDFISWPHIAANKDSEGFGIHLLKRNESGTVIELCSGQSPAARKDAIFKRIGDTVIPSVVPGNPGTAPSITASKISYVSNKDNDTVTLKITLAQKIPKVFLDNFQPRNAMQGAGDAAPGLLIYRIYLHARTEGTGNIGNIGDTAGTAGISWNETPLGDICCPDRIEGNGTVLLYDISKTKYMQVGQSSIGFRLDFFWYHNTEGETMPAHLLGAGERWWKFDAYGFMSINLDSYDPLSQVQDGQVVKASGRLCMYRIVKNTETGKCIKHRIINETDLLALTGDGFRKSAEVSASALANCENGADAPSCNELIDLSSWSSSAKAALCGIKLLDCHRYDPAARLFVSDSDTGLNEIHKTHQLFGAVVETLRASPADSLKNFSLTLIRCKSQGVILSKNGPGEATNGNRGCPPKRQVVVVTLHEEPENKVSIVSVVTEAWEQKKHGFGALVPTDFKLFDDCILAPWKLYQGSNISQLTVDLGLNDYLPNRTFDPANKNAIVATPSITYNTRVAHVIKHDTYFVGAPIIRKDYQSFATATCKASDLPKLHVEHNITFRDVLITTEAFHARTLQDFQLVPPNTTTLSVEEKADALAISPSARSMVMESLTWFGILKGDQEDPLQYACRLAEKIGQVAGYSWPSGTWSMFCAQLFEKATGHCGTFNTVFALALRAHGIPARIVQGTHHAGGMIHTVSQIYVDNIGWMCTDAFSGCHFCIGTFSGSSVASMVGPGVQCISSQYITPGPPATGPHLAWHCHGASLVDMAESAALLGSTWAPPNRGNDFYSTLFDKFAESSVAITAPKFAELIRHLLELDCIEPSLVSEKDCIAAADHFWEQWDQIGDRDQSVGRQDFLTAMSAVDRSSCHNQQGYCGDRSGKASAAYATHGLELYYTDKSTSAAPQPLGFEPVQPEDWVKFSKAQGNTSAGKLGAHVMITSSITTSTMKKDYDVSKQTLVKEL